MSHVVRDPDYEARIRASFAKQTPTATSFAFSDPTLPAGYAPFGIQAIANGAGGVTRLYVSYARQEPPDNFDNANTGITPLNENTSSISSLPSRVEPVS